MKINKQKLQRIISEETERALFENSQEAPGSIDLNNLDKRFVLAAVSIFASKYVKGKENQQIPTTIMIQSSMREGDEVFRKGKDSEVEKFKRGKDGGMTVRWVSVATNAAGVRTRSAGSQIRSKQNKMNLMLDAISAVLYFAKSKDKEIDVINEYTKKIITYARRLQKAPKGKYGLKRYVDIGRKTTVLADAFVEGDLGSRSSEGDNVPAGEKQSDFTMNTIVSYLSGPLASWKDGQFAGIKDKAKAQHEKYSAAFGEKSVLGALRKADVPVEMGGGGLGDESPAEFDRKLKKAMAGSGVYPDAEGPKAKDYEIRRTKRAQERP